MDIDHRISRQDLEVSVLESCLGVVHPAEEDQEQPRADQSLLVQPVGDGGKIFTLQHFEHRTFLGYLGRRGSEIVQICSRSNEQEHSHTQE